MRRILLFMVALLIMSLAVPIFAAGDEMEIGFSMVPLHMVANDGGGDGTEPAPPEDEYVDKDFLDEWLIGFHFGYNMGLLYASVDPFVLPPFLVQDMTSYSGTNPETGEWTEVPGVERPGFLTFIDVGVKLSLSKFVLFGEAGVNHLYIYHQADIPEEQRGSFGTNLRIGASYKVINNLSIGLTGTAIFPNFATMGKVLQGLFSDNKETEGYGDQLKFLPILMIVMYL